MPHVSLHILLRRHILKTKEDIDEAAETPHISIDLSKGLFLARVILFFTL